MIDRRKVLGAAGVAVGGVAAAGLVAGCGPATATPSWRPPGSNPDPAGPSTGPAELTIVPADAAKNVSPAQPVTVTAVTGTLQNVAITGPGGKAVAGELAADGKSWRSTGTLTYGQTFTVTAAAISAPGATPVSKTSRFSTLKPAKTVSVAFQQSAMGALKTGAKYGVGTVIGVHFSRAPADKDAAAKAIEVISDPQVEVRPHWLDDQTVHFRPEQYWAAGTKVTVNAKVYGVNVGKGVYGKANSSVSFTIGPSRVAIADDDTHQMKVYIDGKLTRTIPISMGKGGTVTTTTGTTDFWTPTGTMIVMTKEPSHQMTSASFGITDPKDPNFYDELITLCCRITYSGVFVHSAPWSVSDQGHRDVSHGCINISPSNAQWFFNTFQLGDVVQVKNTGKKMPTYNSMGGAWMIPWSQY
ncbi:MAG: L,D-transpeptidase family protein [Micromonosporaceae bacterium]|nr:L,D-transpeptidase family protein [Micromonosporaceae bacterium]